MAGANIPPRITVEGVAHRVSERTYEPNDKYPTARTVADVVVLTTGGGFAEVRVPSEKLDDCPEQGERVELHCDLYTFLRTNESSGRPYVETLIRLAERRTLPSLAVVPDYSATDVAADQAAYAASDTA